MATHDVSIGSVLQKDSGLPDSATLILTTHLTNEEAIRRTVDDLRGMPVVMADPVLLRIAEFDD